MSLLAPLFLLGALAIALPVVFHLVRRSTRDRAVFSSLLFLRISPPRLARRSKLEHIVLLLLRCSAILLLAAAFARPFLKRELPSNVQPTAPKRTIVLLDTSASMRRAGVWKQALRNVSKVLGEASPADSVAIFTYSREAQQMLGFTEWQAAPVGERVALAQRALANLSPGWGATRSAAALMTVAEAASDSGRNNTPGPTQIVLISDMQEGSHLTELQGYNWPSGVTVAALPALADQSSHASLHLALDKEDAAESSPGVRVRVQNEPGSSKEQFRVGWKGKGGNAGTPLDVYVPAGQSRIVIIPPPPDGSKADRIALEGNGEDFDTTVFVAPPTPALATVLYLGDDSESDSSQPLFFLRHAFQETRRQVVRVISCRPGDGIPSGVADNATLFVVTDSLSEGQAQELHKQVAQGKAILFAPKSAASGQVLKDWIGASTLQVDDVKAGTYAMLGEIDFHHPLFEPFADPRFSDFTKIHFWNYRRLSGVAGIAKSRTLAKFDNGDPALVEFGVEKGHVYFLASGWHPKDSQLGLSSKFVPLLYSVLQQNGAPPPSPTQYFVGDTPPLPAPSPETQIRLIGGEGNELPIAVGDAGALQSLSPGLYTVEVGNERKRFAINVDPAESRIAPLPTDELERLGAPIYAGESGTAKRLAQQPREVAAEIENRQKVWRWLILATLLALLGESWLAGRALRGQISGSTSHA